MIYTDKVISDGLYNVKNGELFKYKANGGSVQVHKIQRLVRCRNCKYWQPHTQYGFDEENGEYHDYCGLLIPDDEYYAFIRKADEFCSRGDRKDDDNGNR